MSNIAVRCTTPEEFRQVTKKCHSQGGILLEVDRFHRYSDICICTDDGRYAREAWYIENGYEIIQAQQFLNEESTPLIFN